ncbi:MAG: hypothetical protein JSV37_12990 [Anaerolineaceae bacterium]|nr:MAG: hypothetical protein JSV37_12990 [Anaerolineaceae bacterium]
MTKRTTTERISRRQFLKELSVVFPSLILFNKKRREPRDLNVLGLHLPFQKIPDETIVEPFKHLILNCGANTVVLDIKNEFGLTHVPFNHIYKPIYSSDLESPTHLSKFLNWADVHGIRVIGRLCLMPDQKLLLSHPRFAFKRKDGTMWRGAQGPWVNPFRLEAAYYNAAIAEAAINFGIKEINIDYFRFPSGEDEIDQIQHTRPSNFATRTGALRDYLEIIYASVKNNGGDLSVDFFGGTAWLEGGDMGIGQHIETHAPFLDGLYPMAYPGLSATKWPGIPESCRVGTDCPYEYVYLITKLTRDRLKKVNPSASIKTWYQAYPDYRFGRMMTLREFEEQQLAAFEAGASGVLAWDTSLVYHQYLYRKINIIRRFTPFASD